MLAPTPAAALARARALAGRDGTIVVAGAVDRGSDDDFGLARYLGGLAVALP